VLGRPLTSAERLRKWRHLNPERTKAHERLSTDRVRKWRECNPERNKLNRKEWETRVKAETGVAPRNARAKKHFERNPADSLLATAKRRARRKGMDFNITREDIPIPEFCPILGVKLTFTKTPNAINPSAPSIDRVDSKKGYIKGNVQIVSHRANILKRDLSLEECEAIAAYMKANLPKS